MTEQGADWIPGLIRPLRVRPGATVDLAQDHDPGARFGLRKKHEGVTLLRRGTELLAEYQARLAAQDTYGVLVVIQALDAAGKDGTIRHVISGVNPQGVGVPFKVPSAEELNHDYLWRYAKNCPDAGEIGIFNRSHYEEVLVVRVHPENSAPAAAQARAAETSGNGATARSTTGSATSRTTASDREDLPEPLPGGAAQPLPRPHRRAREELEVLRRRRSERSAGTTTSGPTRRC